MSNQADQVYKVANAVTLPCFTFWFLPLIYTLAPKVTERFKKWYGSVARPDAHRRGTKGAERGGV